MLCSAGAISRTPGVRIVSAPRQRSVTPPICFGVSLQTLPAGLTSVTKGASCFSSLVASLAVCGSDSCLVNEEDAELLEGATSFLNRAGARALDRVEMNAAREHGERLGALEAPQKVPDVGARLDHEQAAQLAVDWMLDD